MNICFKITKKDLPRLIAALVLAVLGIVFSVSAFYDAVVWFAFLFLLTFITVKIDGSAQGKKKLLRLIPGIILPALASFFSVYFMQMINLAHHPAIAGINWLYDQMYHTESFRWVHESLIVLGVYFLLRMFQVPRRLSAAITPAPFLLLGTVNFYVYTFRGHEIIYSDIFSWETAANVVGNYTFPILEPVMYVLVPYILYIMCCMRIKEDKPAVKNIFVRIGVFAVLSAASITGFCILTKSRSQENRAQDWADKGSRFNGFLINFATTVVTSFAEVPEGYNTQNLDALIKDTGIDVSFAGSADDDSSNIIVIMNESYTDVKSYLPILGCKEDPTPYWRTLKENCLHGKVTTSVYGGNTPNSEYEFLTGITCGYLPNGSIPYLQYVDRETYSLPWALKNMGYSTLAMHPYYSNGWKRTKVYPLIGFDRYMFMDDFEYEQSDLQRDNYLTDSKTYWNLMKQLDAKPKGQKSFTFLVTVQNHGGYTENFMNFTPKKYAKNIMTGKDTQVNTYLTCLNQSDKALEELINYLKTKDEKYTLLIYGDHQPNITSFPNNFGIGKNTSWVTPYIIWTNYEMNPELVAKYKADKVGVTSVNYLALDVMKAAGIKYPGYFQVIDSIRTEIPQINPAGYYSASQKKFFQIEDVTDPKDQKAIQLYRYLQYNMTIDKKDSEFRKAVNAVVKQNEK